jgi:hypothetical protein
MIEMAWACVIRSTDRKLFKRCRRAWDLSSRSRQNLEPINPTCLFDFDRAIHDALAVYYFPGMWEWNREIVLPLAIDGFLKSMQKQRDRYASGQTLSAQQEQDWAHHIELGAELLNRYFQWAPAVDRFSPIRVESEFEVNIPDPLNPGRDLVEQEGIPLRYRGRIDLLAVDGYDAYWLVRHKVVGEWGEIDQLLLDDESVSYCWAWENFFLGMKIAGVIYNEIRKDVSGKGGNSSHAASPVASPEPMAGHRRMYAQANREPDQMIKQQGNDRFRRTQIPRGRKELKNIGKQLALEALDMINPEIRLYPNPSKENCAACDYVAPCIGMNEFGSASAILESLYRKRDERETEEGRIGGSTWSVDRGAIPPNIKGKS